MKSKTTDLIHGNITQSIIYFSIPLLIGNLFQQLYNTVDSYVVGNYVGKAALAAVGGASPIINMLIGFFMGIATGAGVVIATYYGAQDHDNLKKSIHASAALTLIMSVVLTILGLFLTQPILKAISVPDDVFPQSSLYLAIYFGGLTFTLIYNMGAGILRALGDSKRPLYFLAIASIINIVLDFLFVKNFGWGVAGVGIATLISQAISAMMVVIVLVNAHDESRLIIKDIGFYPEILKRIITIGLPTGLQQSIVSLSNVIVQSYVNAFGSSVMAGYSAVIRVDGFINLPLQSFNMSITTFVGQNIGAKQYDRVKKGTRVTLICSEVIICTMALLLMRYGGNVVSLFNNEPDVIAAGLTMYKAFTPFYFLCALNQVISGVLRGAGKSSAPMYIMVFNFVVLRQIYLFIMSQFIHDVYWVFMGWPLTWITCSIMFLIYYFKAHWLVVEE